MIGLDATVDGVPQLINRLKGFEPEVYKILQREVRAAADKVGSSARGLVPAGPPTSHWAQTGRFAWDGKVRSSIRPGFRTRNVGGTRVVSGQVSTRSAAAAIFMVKGKKDSSRLGAILNASHGATFPRALGPAWTMHVDAAREEIKAAVSRAAEAVSNG